MDRLDAMAVFAATVKAGSLSGASRELGQPLATVSRKLANLERHLNTQLLARSTRKLELTDAGRQYLAWCERILIDVQEAERTASGEYSTPRGTLVITAPVVFGRLHLLPVVTDFLDKQHEIDVQLLLADRLNQLFDEHIDLALRIGQLPDSSLVAIPVGKVKLVTCASPGYLEEHGVPLAPNDLLGHTLITFDSSAGIGNWRYPSDNRNQEKRQARLTVTTAEAAIDAAVRGLGITRVLSYQIATAKQEGRLTTILDESVPEPIPVNLVYPRQGLLPLKVRAFIDYAKPRLRNALNASGRSPN